MSEDSKHLLEAACAAVVRLHSGDSDAAERLRLLAWREQSAAHAEAWRRAESLWRGIEPLRGRSIPGSAPLPQELTAVRGFPRRKFFPARGLMATCCMMLILLSVWFFPPSYWRADFVTGKGEQQTISLADGSRVILNTDSAFALHFDSRTRGVELLQGEAFFIVAKDSARPFVVSAGQGSVTAVGTEFGVRRDDEYTHVELVEGLVRVRDGRREELLKPGQALVYGNGGLRMLPASRPDLLSTWRDGYLVFDGTPLEDAVAQINRYRPGRILLMNEQLRKRQVSGLFRLDALNGAVDTIAAALPAQQSRLTSYWVVLR
ncbi:FecR family protein [Methyloterricola oryzae]|uniref:FecR family protein n=1 Tax=Methyloterricola oryzae TaxID=1495050 RepID=UPI0005EB20BF|nr:FecR family protein [Methyloterricola oryzae]